MGNTRINHLKRMFLILFLLAISLNIGCSSRTGTVYVTDTGAKYHRSGCQYLKESKHSISKRVAQSDGYTACYVCDPDEDNFVLVIVTISLICAFVVVTRIYYVIDDKIQKRKRKKNTIYIE